MALNHNNTQRGHTKQNWRENDLVRREQFPLNSLNCSHMVDITVYIYNIYAHTCPHCTRHSLLTFEYRGFTVLLRNTTVIRRHGCFERGFDECFEDATPHKKKTEGCGSVSAS